MILIPKMYSLMHRFQIYLWVGITPLMMGAHVTNNQFFYMWAIYDLEWIEYLAYDIMCCYI
jgi:hypothetical protein